MIKLNLFKERKEKQVKAPRGVLWQLWVYVISIILVLSAAGYVFWLQQEQLKQLQRQKSELDEKIKQYEKYDAILKELQSKLEEAKKRKEVISNLIKDKDTTVRLLALLTMITPEDRMWFEEIRYAGNTVTVIGFAKSNETIVEFMRSLETSKFSERESINLIRSRSEELSGNVLRRFEIQFQFKSFSKVFAENKPKENTQPTQK